jgi:hypothetical protein
MLLCACAQRLQSWVSLLENLHAPWELWPLFCDRRAMPPVQRPLRRILALGEAVVLVSDHCTVYVYVYVRYCTVLYCTVLYVLCECMLCIHMWRLS